jgi:hypothetical protein
LTAIKTNPEQSTRSGSYQLLPQLARSPGGAGCQGMGCRPEIEPIKPKVGSETSAHNAAIVHSFAMWSNTRKLNKLMYPVRNHLFFKIGANVLSSGKRHHLTTLISTLRHTVIFGPVKNGPKLGANLTRLRLFMTHWDLRFV